MHELIPLSQLSNGRKAAVGAVIGLPDAVHRLEELGLRKGTIVEMVKSGSPCIVRLGENKVCLRADELLTVLVATEDAA